VARVLIAPRLCRHCDSEDRRRSSSAESRADKDVDFLRLALADEIATSLSYVRTLTIRPFATTSKYDSPSLDLQEAGKAMHVTDVVTGHYMKQATRFRSPWKPSMSRQPLRLARHHDRLRSRHDCHAQPNHGEKCARGWSQLWRRNGFRRGRYPSQERRSYDIYLRSIAVPHDPLPNKDAIAMLERAAGMDPSYAPAWSALGLRYYFDSQYSNGGEAMFSVRTPPWNGQWTGSEPGRSGRSTDRKRGRKR